MTEQRAEGQDGFLDGLVVGAVIGAVVGSAIASLVISRRFRREQSVVPLPTESAPDAPVPPGRLEDARRTLEQKIAELNQAIDETRNRLYANSPPPSASSPPESLS